MLNYANCRALSQVLQELGKHTGHTRETSRKQVHTRQHTAGTAVSLEVSLCSLDHATCARTSKRNQRTKEVNIEGFLQELMFSSVFVCLSVYSSASIHGSGSGSGGGGGIQVF